MNYRLASGKSLALVIIGGLILVFLISQAAGLFMLSDNNSQVSSGYIDLSDWGFGRNGNLALDGDWESYWDDGTWPYMSDWEPDKISLLVTSL